MRSNVWNHHIDRPMRKQSRWAVILLAMLLGPVVLVAGCNTASDVKNLSSQVEVKRETSHGDVDVVAELDRQVVQVAQPLRLKITATAPEGVSVQFPQQEKQIGDFRVIDQQDQFDIPAGAERIWMRSYQLESLSSGKKTIPPIDLSFVDRREGKAVRNTVQTESLAVEIKSLLEGQADPRKFRDIKGVVQLAQADVDQSSWLPYGLSVGGAVFAAGLLLLLWHRQKKNHTPAEWAIQQLAALQKSSLLKDGYEQKFYCRVTDIIRQYIEARFGHRAPKQTTSEFLSAMQRDNLLCAEHRASLQEFLQVADMIKFACHRPSSADADDAVDRARGFVLETANESNDRSDATKEKVEV